MITVAGNYR